MSDATQNDTKTDRCMAIIDIGLFLFRVTVSPMHVPTQH